MRRNRNYEDSPNRLISAGERNQQLRSGSKATCELTALVPGAGLEPARTLAGPRDFKSRVSTNSTIRAGWGLRIGDLELGKLYFLRRL